MPLHEDIGKAVERVRGAKRIVLRQRRILVDMSRHGHPTGAAEDLLETFEDILADYRAHLTLLLHQKPSDQE